ncbi:unnamed protein product, partial [Iphiclides podalirius]
MLAVSKKTSRPSGGTSPSGSEESPPGRLRPETIRFLSVGGSASAHVFWGEPIPSQLPLLEVSEKKTYPRGLPWGGGGGYHQAHFGPPFHRSP